MTYIGNNPTYWNLNKYSYVATEGQTEFLAVYDSEVDVYLNGVKLQKVVDYTAESGISIILVTAANAGDVIDINGYFNMENFDINNYIDLASLNTGYPINGIAPTDLDDAGQGIWLIGAGHINQAPDTEAGTLLSFDNAGDTGFQIATDFSNNKIYWRSGNPGIYGGAGGFGEWREIVHSGNIELQTAGSALQLLGYKNVDNGNEITIASGFTGGALYMNYRGASSPITSISLFDGTSSGTLVPIVASNISATGDITGNAATATNADRLDGQHGSYYAPVNTPTFTGNGVIIPSLSSDPSSAVAGQMYYNTTDRTIKHYNGSIWVQMSKTLVASGGNSVYDAGGYRIHVFTSSGTFTPTSTGIVEYLIVAGGGGGGAGTSSGYEAGGGGAGGVLTGAASVTKNSYTVIVGAGGSPTAKGSDSSAFGITTIGGGYGASSPNGGGSGGSGGGGSHNCTSGGSGTNGQGYNGATPSSSSRGAGGGGASEPGDTDGPGSGGDGLLSSITGSATYYGGGGAAYAASAGILGDPGLGGGGASTSTQGGSPGSGVTNTGGGGGAAYTYTGQGGGSGGSGIVIIRYEL